MSYILWQKNIVYLRSTFPAKKLLSWSLHFALTISGWAHTKCWLAGIAIQADGTNPVIHSNTVMQNLETAHLVHIECSWVLYDSDNKQRLFCWTQVNCLCNWKAIYSTSWEWNFCMLCTLNWCFKSSNCFLKSFPKHDISHWLKRQVTLRTLVKHSPLKRDNLLNETSNISTPCMSVCVCYFFSLSENGIILLSQWVYCI
jgi:hypothetical protein